MNDCFLDAKLFKEKFNEAKEIVRTRGGKEKGDLNAEEKENTPENREDDVTNKLAQLDVKEKKKE